MIARSQVHNWLVRNSRLTIALILALLGLCLVLFESDFCHAPMMFDPTSKERLGPCWEFWFNRYQTLLAGIFALIAAGVAWIGVAEQVRVARLPLVTRDGSKVRALIDEAEETDSIVARAVNYLVTACTQRSDSTMNKGPLLIITPEIEKARRDLVRRWTDNDLPDGAADALHEYLKAIIFVRDEAKRIADEADDLMIVGLILPPHKRDRAHALQVQAVALERKRSEASQAFFTRLQAERAAIARQRAKLLGLPLEPKGRARERPPTK